MDLPSLDLVSLFFKLLPGFLAAAVFHTLTPFPKRDALDRVVNALIFTLFAQLAVSAVEPLCYVIGTRYVEFGQWTPTVALGWAAFFGLVLGVVASHAVNNDYPHRILRWLRTTKKSSFPTQWCEAFSKFDRFIILHFSDGRRLKGWPLLWPDEPTGGHFILEKPAWVFADGREAKMHQIEVYLVGSENVAAIEFLRFDQDPVLQEKRAEIKEVAALLSSSRQEESNDKSTEQAKPAKSTE